MPMPKSDKPTELEKLLQGIKIPPQPQIMVDLHMEQAKPEPDLEEIAELICQDVGLSGSMLKIVNSASYGLVEPISSIKQAVMLMGMNQAINIINGLAIKVEMSDENVAFMNRFWDSAMDVAMTITGLARNLGISSPESAYSLGLFHNCGVPLLYRRFENYEEVAQQAYGYQSGRLIDLENATFRTNHAVAGYYTAKSWRVPYLICQVIAEHHNTFAQVSDSSGQNSEKLTLFCLLKMAEHICSCYQIIGQQTEDFEWQDLEDPVLQHLGISAYDFQNIKDQFSESGIGGGDYDSLSDSATQ